MKKTIVLLTFILMFAAALFAEEKEVTLKGNIKYEYGMYSEITSGGKTYLLMIPRYFLDDVKNGDVVEVAGFTDKDEASYCYGRFYNTEKDKNKEVFIVTKLTHNGKTINIDEQRGRMSSKRPGRGFRR